MSRAYYNEHDPFAAAWLRELIAAGEIAAGDVDDRSITDVQPSDLAGYTQYHFFAGIGGWSLALRRAGWPDDRPVWTGSCPCQPFSSAGKGACFDDPRHLWPTWFRLIRERCPPIVFGEQVASRAGLGWWDHVAVDLEAIGYAVGAADLPAASIGAWHIRQRLWWVADAECGAAERRRHDMAGATGDPEGAARQRERIRDGVRTGGPACAVADARRERAARHPGEDGGAGDGPRPEPDPCREAHGMGDADCARPQARPRVGRAGECATRPTGVADVEWLYCRDGKYRPTQRGLQPLVAGLSRGMVPSGDPSASEANATAEARVGRLRGYGNAIHPDVAAVFIRAVMA